MRWELKFLIDHGKICGKRPRGAVTPCHFHKNFFLWFNAAVSVRSIHLAVQWPLHLRKPSSRHLIVIHTVLVLVAGLIIKIDNYEVRWCQTHTSSQKRILYTHGTHPQTLKPYFSTDVDSLMFSFLISVPVLFSSFLKSLVRGCVCNPRLSLQLNRLNPLFLCKTPDFAWIRYLQTYSGILTLLVS